MDDKIYVSNKHKGIKEIDGIKTEVSEPPSITQQDHENMMGIFKRTMQAIEESKRIELLTPAERIKEEIINTIRSEEWEFEELEELFKQYIEVTK